MKIYIKYMVSGRCKSIVQGQLTALGLRGGPVELGEVELLDYPTVAQHHQLRLALLSAGLELLDDKKAQLIERIKATIVVMVQGEELAPKTTHSEYLSGRLQHGYTYLATLFSEATGTTIEQHIIHHKIELVKELLLYDELNLTQISYRLNYSSVAHLSNQFKKVTGLTPSFFKKLRHQRLQVMEMGNTVNPFCNCVMFPGVRRLTFAQ
jgi:AraC-like DNA-binding protein